MISVVLGFFTLAIILIQLHILGFFVVFFFMERLAKKESEKKILCFREQYVFSKKGGARYFFVNLPIDKN